MTAAARPCSNPSRPSAAGALAAGALVLLAAIPARAQDAIGDALASPPHPADTTVATATPPASTPASTPSASAPEGEPASGAPAAAPTSQPNIDQGEISPDGPPNETALAYDARLRASVAAAQSLQGPLDGRWTLYGEDGKPLYVFMFTDPANGRGPLEAAWRDPSKIRGMGDLGVVDVVGRDGPTLNLTFYARPGAPATRIELQAGTTGGFQGRMDQAGAARTVSLRR